jgi:hypothetical protein
MPITFAVRGIMPLPTAPSEDAATTASNVGAYADTSYETAL